ncbi:MAG: Legionella pneumophila major outer membrane protein precursor, partial [Gammaproteobacteria bacterium]|nr:Legionella pneumophila major outer membrane protein precursor [Gammaproteobacteria bacterium]
NSAVTTYYDADNVAVGTVSAANDSNSQTHVVPEIDGRLGLNYTYDYNSAMAMGFELGWQATNYFNVVADGSTTGPYEDNTNFGVQGPYARVQLDIA